MLNCARSRQAGPFSREEIALIDLFGSFVIPLVARHEFLFETMGLSRNCGPSVQALEKRFEQLFPHSRSASAKYVPGPSDGHDRRGHSPGSVDRTSERPYLS